MLIDKIKADLVAAMKNKNEVGKMVLRSLLSAINYSKIEKQRELVDEDIQTVLAKEAKKHRESIEMYEKGNRGDLAEKEKAELTILESYMTRQMDVRQVEEIIRAEVEKLKASGSVLNPGIVMKAVMPLLKGKADGKAVKEMVDKLIM